MENTYEAPAIVEIASLAELTLDIDKTLAPKSDGYTFNKAPINNAS